MDSDESTEKSLRCGLCGKSVEDVEGGNKHLKDSHSFFELLKHDLVERTPPIQRDRNV